MNNVGKVTYDYEVEIMKDGMKMNDIFIIRLNAGHDANGNPRRAYVLYNTKSGIALDIWNEGYQGYNAVPEQYRYMTLNAPTIPTSASFIKELKRLLK